MNQDPTLSSCLLVHQGAPGGIGEVERLLDRAFASFGWRVTSLRRQPRAATSRLRVGHKALFALQTLVVAARRQPALIVISHLNFAVLALAIRVITPRSKVVYIASGIEAWQPLGPSAILSLKAVNAVWCISDFTRASLVRESRINPRKLSVLPLGLAEDKASVINEASRGRSALRTAGFDLLTVSRLATSERYKGIEHVLHCVAALKAAGHLVRYRIIGQGSDRDALLHLAQELGVLDVVRADGAVDNRRVAQAVAECDAFVLPSAKEGFGLAHLEAMCAGKPVIAAHAGATPEVVDGVGLLTRFADSEGLVDAVERLISDETYRRSVGTEARAFYLKHFTESKFGERVRELVERV